MPISNKYKIVFVHIPKTGGTPIEYALGMHGRISYVGISPYLNQKYDEKNLFGKGSQHMTAIDIKKKIGTPKFIQYYKFSIVRNPYERLVSSFAWMNGKWYKNKKLTQKEFRQAILNINKKKYIKNTHLKPQYTFLCDEKYRFLVDDVFRYENYEEDLNKLFMQINIPFNLQKRMVSNHDPYMLYYDEKLITIVNDLYEIDFKIFGYERK